MCRRLKAFIKRTRKAMGMEQSTPPSTTVVKNVVKTTTKKASKKTAEPKPIVQVQPTKKKILSRPVTPTLEFRFDRSLIELAFTNAWNGIVNKA